MIGKEIIKALECCISPECDNCPYDGDDLLRPCNHNLMKDALDLINRQQVEIERLNKEIDRLSQVVLYNTNVDEIKSEAIKDFAERLLPLLYEDVFEADVITENIIDNLVREMVGEWE